MSGPSNTVREFVFIRHGESESNANLVTQHPLTVQLTRKGQQQAQDKAAVWLDKPDVFVTSKYLRTQQTALPFRDKFTDVPVEEWDIHEFTYLAPEKYKNTTGSDRMPFSDTYWRNADPHYKDSATAESFAEFAARCLNALTRMKASPHRLSVAFCHGYFIKGLIFAIDGRFNDISAAAMTDFIDFHKQVPLDNCMDVRFKVSGADISYCVAHLVNDDVSTPILPTD